MSQPLVSVIIPTYNAALFLPRSIKSVLNQSYKNIEIIIVDDASTDNTQQVLQEFNGNILVIKNSDNQGVGYSRNVGIKIARGEYIASLDADDWYHKNKIKEQVDFLETHMDYGLVGTSCFVFRPHNKKNQLVYYPRDNTEIKKLMFKKSSFCHSSVVFRKEVLKKIGGYDSQIRAAVDYDIFFRLYLVTKMHNLSEPLVFYLVRKGSISVDSRKKQIWSGIKIRIKYIKMYHKSWLNYLHCVKPLLEFIAPRWVPIYKKRIQALLNR